MCLWKGRKFVESWQRVGHAAERNKWHCWLAPLASRAQKRSERRCPTFVALSLTCILLGLRPFQFQSFCTTSCNRKSWLLFTCIYTVKQDCPSILLYCLYILHSRISQSHAVKLLDNRFTARWREHTEWIAGRRWGKASCHAVFVDTAQGSMLDSRLGKWLIEKKTFLSRKKRSGSCCAEGDISSWEDREWN